MAIRGGDVFRGFLAYRKPVTDRDLKERTERCLCEYVKREIDTKRHVIKD